MNLSDFWNDIAYRTNVRLEALLLGWDNNCLREAAHYALARGKRLRPVLMAASSYALGMDVEKTLSIGVAIECLHAFSLVHDDLPGLDNDAVRRGMASVHKAFGEGTAILVGDALWMLAFNTLLKIRDIPKEIAQEMVQASLDMIRGQALDSKHPPDEKALITSMALKTGSIMRFCVLVPGIIAQADASVLLALKTYAHHFGLLYQIVDDIQDGEGCIHVLGQAKSQILARQQTQAACEALDGLDAQRCSLLKNLAILIHNQLLGHVPSAHSGALSC